MPKGPVPDLSCRDDGDRPRGDRLTRVFLVLSEHLRSGGRDARARRRSMTSTLEQVLVDLAESGAHRLPHRHRPRRRAGRALLQGRLGLLGVRPGSPRSARGPPHRLRRPVARGLVRRARRPDTTSCRAGGSASCWCTSASSSATVVEAFVVEQLQGRHGRAAGLAGRRPQVPQEQEDPPGRRAADERARPAGRDGAAPPPVGRAASTRSAASAASPCCPPAPTVRPTSCCPAPTGPCCARWTARRTIAELAAECGFTVFEAAHVVKALMDAGLVDVDLPDDEPVASVTSLEDARGKRPADERGARPASTSSRRRSRRSPPPSKDLFTPVTPPGAGTPRPTPRLRWRRPRRPSGRPSRPAAVRTPPSPRPSSRHARPRSGWPA